MLQNDCENTENSDLRLSRFEKISIFHSKTVRVDSKCVPLHRATHVVAAQSYTDSLYML